MWVRPLFPVRGLAVTVDHWRGQYNNAGAHNPQTSTGARAPGAPSCRAGEGAPRREGRAAVPRGQPGKLLAREPPQPSNHALRRAGGQARAGAPPVLSGRWRMGGKGRTDREGPGKAGQRRARADGSLPGTLHVRNHGEGRMCGKAAGRGLWASTRGREGRPAGVRRGRSRAGSTHATAARACGAARMRRARHSSPMAAPQAGTGGATGAGRACGEGTSGKAAKKGPIRTGRAPDVPGRPPGACRHDFYDLFQITGGGRLHMPGEGGPPHAPAPIRKSAPGKGWGLAEGEALSRGQRPKGRPAGQRPLAVRPYGHRQQGATG